MRSLNVPALALALTLATSSWAAPVDGVDPRVYLKARKPVPSAIADLKLAPLDVSLRILKDGPEGFLVEDSAYPPALDHKAREELRVLERRALLVGALHAVADQKPTGVASLIAGQLAARDPLVRAEAADQLGELGDIDTVVTVLARVAREDADVRVREAACVGLAKARSLNALSALAPFVLDSSDEARQRAAIRALPVLGSKWAWQARGDVAGGRAVRTEARALLAKVTGANLKVVADVEKQLR